ncbi:hypothetical protein BH11MYX4_BH11MYX4_24480 [soil metagenome]
MTTAKLVSLALLLTACAPTPSPPSAPVIVATPPAPALATWDGALVFDGVKLGSPIGALLARAPYDTPCDVDPIDKKTATLFFWAGGRCREAPAFPAATTLVILTPRATDAARGEQPVTLVAWAGGTYFDDRTSLPIRIGDAAEHARRLLGAPTATKQSDDSSTFSWGSVHALVIADKIAALAMGDLDIKAGGERAETLERLHHHHLRYAKRAGVR